MIAPPEEETLPVKFMAAGMQAVVASAVNDTIGEGNTVIYAVLVIPLAPFELRTTSLTVYVPGTEKVTPGFCKLESCPFPKSQSQYLGSPVDKSLKDTPSGAHPDTGDAEKSATGACPKADTPVMSTRMVLKSLRFKQN